MNDNICLFAHSGGLKADDDISILNLVLETNINNATPGFKIRSSYSFHVVISGEGIFETPGKKINLRKGVFFITYPSTSFKIVSTNNLRYIYLSFVGNKFISYSDKLLISKTNNAYYDESGDLVNYYKHILSIANHSNVASSGLAIFYYTISKLTMVEDEKCKEESTVANKIKKYVDDNYQDKTLTLSKAAKLLSYNPNYISMLFKKAFNVQFSVYLQNVRLSAALSLMNSGFTSVKEIANLVGFNDSLYFSKTFKKAYLESPSYFIKNKNKLYNIKN